MDKREEKTLNAVYEALRLELGNKEYQDISVSDLLTTAHISRSTFYSHFKSKEDVLVGVCSTIFDHVFSPSQQKEADHDFSGSSHFDYRHLITHIFYHFYDEKSLISALLSSRSGAPIFLENLKERSLPLMSACVKSHTFYKPGIPEEMQTHQLTESFVSLLRYWVSGGCVLTPEEMTDYFSRLYA